MRDVRGIALYSIALAAYEALALTTRRTPTITTLSHKPPWMFLVLGWWGLLGYHFYVNRENDDSSNDD